MSINAVPGSASADSYVDLAESNSYFFGSKKDIWDDIDSTEKESLLKEATRLLDQFFDWSGTISSDSQQSLRWPRNDAFDQDGRPIASNSIPKAIKQGTIEFALYIKTNSGFDVTQNTLNTVKVGPIRLDFKDNVRDDSFPKMVLDIVSSVGSLKSVSTSGIGQPKLVRT